MNPNLKRQGNAIVRNPLPKFQEGLNVTYRPHFVSPFRVSVCLHVSKLVFTCFDIYNIHIHIYIILYIILQYIYIHIYILTCMYLLLVFYSFVKTLKGF